MKKNNKTQTIGELLNNSVFENSNIKDKMHSVIKHSTIFSFWTNVVGAKFARFTKPYAIKYNKLYVAVKSPAIVQELNLYKTKLLQKINSYSVPLNIKITDMIFDYKNYNASVPKTLNETEDKPVFLNKEDIKNTVLDEEVQKEFKEKIDKINFLNNAQKETLLDKILSAKKAKFHQDK